MIQVTSTVGVRPRNRLQVLEPSRMEKVELKLILEGRRISTEERRVSALWAGSSPFAPSCTELFPAFYFLVTGVTY